VTVLEWIGSMTVAVVTVGAGMMIRETIRAFRQARRVARYLYGKQWLTMLRKRGFIRNFGKQVVNQFGTGQFSIGPVIFPADPTKPFRHRWYG
jgi:hypothetical protein